MALFFIESRGFHEFLITIEAEVSVEFLMQKRVLIRAIKMPAVPFQILIKMGIG